jgi:hypothetical protein
MTLTAPGESSCVVPGSAVGVTITAVGGSGASGGQGGLYQVGVGGVGGAVKATFAVQKGGAIRPWQTLYFEIGSNAPAKTGAGGANGGGSARGGDEGPYGPGGAGAGVARLTCAAPRRRPDCRLTLACWSRAVAAVGAVAASIAAAVEATPVDAPGYSQD